MTLTEDPHEPTRLPPADAFEVLGNETRVQILQTLGEAEGPLSFTELRDRVGIRQGSQFNYHLDKVVGHFVGKLEDGGYELRQPGRRVVQAVLSEAVTDAPVMDRTQIDHPCPYCGAPIEIRYHEGHVEMFCVECGGMEGGDGQEQGHLGCLMLPPAGLEGRSVEEAFQSAWTWTRLSIFAIATGLCPHCSATLNRWVEVCEEHETSSGLCSACDRRSAVEFNFECSNCIYEGSGSFDLAVAANTDLLAFLTTRGLNPISAEESAAVGRVLDDNEVRVESTEPFTGKLRFSADGKTLTLIVNETLNVVRAETSEATAASHGVVN